MHFVLQFYESPCLCRLTRRQPRKRLESEETSRGLRVVGCRNVTTVRAVRVISRDFARLVADQWPRRRKFSRTIKRDPSFDGEGERVDEAGKENAVCSVGSARCTFAMVFATADIFGGAFVPACRRHRRKKDTDLSTLRFLSDIAFTQRRALSAEDRRPTERNGVARSFVKLSAGCWMTVIVPWNSSFYRFSNLLRLERALFNDRSSTSFMIFLLPV